MTEQRNAMAELFAACWKDEALKARFMSDPKAVLTEHGIDIFDNVAVKVVENTDNTVHITMPMPPDGHEELSIEELTQRSSAAKLFVACWKDEALKARFMSDPKAVLAERGVDIPGGIDVKVVENTDNCVHITMPAAPAGDGELSDEELSNVAGGFTEKVNNWDRLLC